MEAYLSRWNIFRLRYFSPLIDPSFISRINRDDGRPGMKDSSRSFSSLAYAPLPRQIGILKSTSMTMSFWQGSCKSCYDLFLWAPIVQSNGGEFSAFAACLPACQKQSQSFSHGSINTFPFPSLPYPHP